MAGEQSWSGVRKNGASISPGRGPWIVRPWSSASPPRPTPPRAARPTFLSVTEIESWLRDPYTIYARRILRLRALDPVDLRLAQPTAGS